MSIDIKNTLANIRFLRMFYIKHLKKFDGKLRIYLTLECNLRCPFCVNQFFKGTDENKVDAFGIIEDHTKWARAINREGRDVIFTGGEPSLYPHLIDLINALDSGIRVQIDTNLVWSKNFLERYINDLKKPVTLYASYHPGAGDPQKVISVIQELKRHDKFRGYVHLINHKLTKDYLKKIRSAFNENGIDLMIDDDQNDYFEGCSRKFRKRVTCFKKVILVAPNGMRYPCLSYLIRQKGALENFIEDGIRSPLSTTDCADYGFCAPCDGLGEMKIKKI